MVTKVNTIDTSGFVLKSQYNTDRSSIGRNIDDADKKIPDICGLFKKTDYNAKITAIEGKIPSAVGLATIVALTAFEIKIPNISNLVKKADYDAKISDIESKYFTMSGYNKFKVEILDAKIEEKGLVDKSTIAGFIFAVKVILKIMALKIT